DERAGVIRIPHPAGARIAGAEVTLRVVGGLTFRRGLFDLPLPRALGAVRGDQHPFARQLIEAAVRVFFKVEFRAAHFSPLSAYPPGCLRCHSQALATMVSMSGNFGRQLSSR